MATRDFSMKTTPEQQVAIEKMRNNRPSEEIFKVVAEEVPQSVPDASNKHAWIHGSYCIMGMIGGQSEWDLESGMAPDGIDLSDIQYVGFWRQAVANKSGEVKGFFSTVPLSFAGEAIPGSSIPVNGHLIPLGASDEDVRNMAKESLLRLQELTKEYAEG